MASPPKHLQLLILAAAAAEAEAMLAVLKRAQLPVRGAFSHNPKSLIRANQSDLILACMGPTISATEVVAAYAEIDQRIPLIVIAPPGEQDAAALQLLHAGAHGLLTPADEGGLIRAVKREWKIWNTAYQAKLLKERLRRSERHLQALLKAGAEARPPGQGGATERQAFDPQEAYRSLLGAPDNTGSSHGGLMDLLPAEYRESLEPLLAGQPKDQPDAQSGTQSGAQSDAQEAQSDEPSNDRSDAPVGQASKSAPQSDLPAEPDLRLKPSGATSPPMPAAPPPSDDLTHEPLELQPASQPAAPPSPDGELPPLTLATSEEPLPDLDEQPQVLSGRELSDDELIAQIERALKTDGFKLAYQPLVSLRGDSQERYSVLLRLLDDNRSFRAADDLLEPAARSGKLPEVDRWVIQQAMRELSERRRLGHRAHFLLSLSAALLQDQELLIWICDQLRQHSIRGNWLSFQIQENDARNLGDTAFQLASGLRQVKSQLVIGNFGSNTDSELMLNDFPLDFVRLAPSLTQNLDSDDLKQGHLKHLIDVAQQHHIKTLVGHIEDEHTLAKVWSAGADYVQGKLLGRPSSIFELND
ncbi:EAL domain-containing protein [Rhabdochromatium marinum]|uniref:EAL domain-containing protein n=1 Tax=Rhabdochromatium marinum TaxID=48729 RepID=UPI0019033DF9|nr:EAL domain-containing protein [Rhabdochromatium marinum]MBK1647084.1 hypothetical protein [Rhabdochromatium marinum]